MNNEDLKIFTMYLIYVKNSDDDVYFIKIATCGLQNLSPYGPAKTA
jgi:hypothetical protein